MSEPREPLILEGEAELVEQEGGYAHSALKVDGTYLCDELSYHLGVLSIDEFCWGMRVGRIKLTIEFLPDRPKGQEDSA